MGQGRKSGGISKNHKKKTVGPLKIKAEKQLERRITFWFRTFFCPFLQQILINKIAQRLSSILSNVKLNQFEGCFLTFLYDLISWWASTLVETADATASFGRMVLSPHPAHVKVFELPNVLLSTTSNASSCYFCSLINKRLLQTWLSLAPADVLQALNSYGCASSFWGVYVRHQFHRYTEHLPGISTVNPSPWSEEVPLLYLSPLWSSSWLSSLRKAPSLPDLCIETFYFSSPHRPSLFYGPFGCCILALESNYSKIWMLHNRQLRSCLPPLSSLPQRQIKVQNEAGKTPFVCGLVCTSATLMHILHTRTRVGPHHMGITNKCMQIHIYTIFMRTTTTISKKP